MAINGYGKFGADSTTPLQLWEPDFQPTIVEFIDNYLSGRDRHVPSGSGLAFAINTDIAMFDVFSSRSNLAGDEARGYDVDVESSEGGSAPILFPTTFVGVFSLIFNDGSGDQIARSILFGKPGSFAGDIIISPTPTPTSIPPFTPPEDVLIGKLNSLSRQSIL